MDVKKQYDKLEEALVKFNQMEQLGIISDDERKLQEEIREILEGFGKNYDDAVSEQKWENKVKEYYNITDIPLKVFPQSIEGKEYVIATAPDVGIDIPNGVDVVGIYNYEFGKENLIEGRCRPADDMEDAVDVAMEMLNDCPADSSLADEAKIADGQAKETNGSHKVSDNHNRGER